jgi:hypothetical protein
LQSASEGVSLTPPPCIEFNKPIQKPRPSTLAGGEKPKERAAEPIEPTHAIFRIPPYKWEKSRLQKDATGTTYLVENVWVRESIGADNKITYHYYAPSYDMNASSSWQFFEPKAEQKVDLETDLPEVSVEDFRYTAEQVAEIKAQRDALIYIIASDDVLFLKFYLNDKYSQEFRTKLYHMNISIGSGEVAKAVAAVGLGFATMATAPILIGSNLARSLITDYIVGEVVDKISAAAGLPIGEILAFRDIKNIISQGVENMGKKGAKSVLPSFNKNNTPEIKGGKRPADLVEGDKNALNQKRKENNPLQNDENPPTPEIKGGKRLEEVVEVDKNIQLKTSKRYGNNIFDVTETPISKIQKIHAAPKKGKPQGYIEGLTAEFKNNGYDISNSPPIEGYLMPDGQVLIIDGHHRLAALEELGEKTIPIRITTKIRDEGLLLQLKIGEISGFYPPEKYPKGFKIPNLGLERNMEIEREARIFLNKNF